MLSEVLSRVVFYDWLLLALFILIIEMLTGTMYLLWPGLAAVITGLIFWLVPDLSWQMQLVIFSVTTIASMLLWFKYGKEKSPTGGYEHLNQRGQQYVGKQYPLIEAIENGRGIVDIDDTRWSVRGPDKAKGELVTVKSIDGNILNVE